jgi:hypothetical protein
MPNCPQCTKPLREISRRCPSCQADLDLLVDYVSHLQGGLTRAENLVKAGELGQAIWAYLEVLEVDPDNPQARKQIGMVVTAVRQFDTVVPGRRWANNLPPLPKSPLAWWHWAILGAAVLAAFAIGIGVTKIELPDVSGIELNKPDEGRIGQ